MHLGAVSGDGAHMLICWCEAMSRKHSHVDSPADVVRGCLQRVDDVLVGGRVNGAVGHGAGSEQLLQALVNAVDRLWW